MPIMIQLVFTAILSLACAGCEVQNPDGEPFFNPDGRWGGQVTVAPGEDYSLPSWAQPTQFSGYVGHRDLLRPVGSMRVENCWLTWADLEPERGQYNWDLVENRLAAAAAGGYQLNLHLMNITYGGGDEALGIDIPRKVPDWVEEEFNLTEEDIVNLGWEFDILIIPGWRPEIRTAFNDLIRAFGERGYPQSPQLASTYILGISPSRGEEFWMTQNALNVLEREHDFSVQVLDDWISSRFEAYGDAFAGVTHKLVWVGKQGSWQYLNPGQYSDLALRLVQDAWAMGAGNRSSAIEYYNQWLGEPALGQSVDENGYLMVDETIPPLDAGSYFGDENEEYGEQWAWRFGSMSGEPQRYRFSALRALQMRLRFLWTSEAAEAINPALSHYVGMSLGKTVETSPDAWSYLKESPIHSSNTPSRVLRNFERWLTQRDLPGGMTIPTQRSFREFDAGSNYQGGPDTWYDDLARRTDRSGGSPFIFFDLDDRFLVNGEVKIKVEILDDSNATWYLQYTNSSHDLVATEAYTNQGDGQVKTVTFTLSNARFLNGLENGMDFRITCDGPGDVAVRWVRVIRGEAP